MKNQSYITNPKYFYRDHDIWRLLNLRCQQESSSNAIVMPPISNLEGDLFSQQLQEEASRNESIPNRILLIPYNIGNFHWIGIAIQITNNNITSCTYYDSLPQQETTIESILMQLKNDLKSLNYNGGIIRGEGFMQPDSTSCGPLTIENLVNAGLGQIVVGISNIHDIRFNHIHIMDRFSPENYFYLRQLHNLPLFQFHSQYNQASQTQSNDNVEDESMLITIADNYKQRNDIPDISKKKLLEYILRSIEKAHLAYTKDHSWNNQEMLKYLTAISAISKALQVNYQKFTEASPGIPWDELSNLVRDVNIHYEPSHGIAGHIIAPNKKAYLAPDFRKKLIKEIIGDLDELEIVFKELSEFEFVQQELPIANRIRAINHYLSEELGVELLKKGAEACLNLELNSSEMRVLYLRQLALIGEAFVQLPDYLLQHFDSNFVIFCKKIRNAIDHFETEFIQSNSGDKELKAIVLWLKSFIETSNYSNAPNILAKTTLVDLINSPKEIKTYIEPVLQKIFPPTQTLPDFTPLPTEEHSGLSFSFIDDEEKEQDFMPGSMAVAMHHKYVMDLLLSPEDQSGTESWREDFERIINNSKSYLEEFITQISLESNLYAQIQFLYFVRNNSDVLEHKLIDKAQEIEENLLLISIKPIINKKTGEVIKEVVTVKGKLNEIALKGGAEKLSNVDAIVYYLHLFRDEFTTLSSSLTKEESHFVKQYESVKVSYLAKIKQVMQSPHLKDKEKFKYIGDFLKFFQYEFEFIDTKFRELFHNQSNDTLSENDLNFYFFYDRCIKSYQSLSERIQQSSQTSHSKKADMESAISLISGIIAINDKVQEYFVKIADLSVGINSIDEHSLEVLNRYTIGMDLLRGIGGDEFILQENQGKVIIRDKDVKAFTKFLQQSPQEAAETFGKELQKLKSADLNLKAIIAQQNALSYGLQIHNPISLPEGYDTATFNPIRDIEYFSGLYDLEEQENISQLSQLYHANREFYQILIGSYARALLDNEIFMQYASDRLHTTLHHLRAGRGYLGHNTELIWVKEKI